MFPDPRSQKFSLYSQFLQDLCLSLLLISIVFEIATIRRSDSFSHAIIAENEIAVFDAGLLFQRNVRQPREYALNVFLPTNPPGGVSRWCDAVYGECRASISYPKRVHRATLPRSSLEDVDARRLQSLLNRNL